jgi:adenosine deaminase
MMGPGKQRWIARISANTLAAASLLVMGTVAFLPRAALAHGPATVASPAVPALWDKAREAAVASRIAQAAHSPAHLRLLLRAMPKGGDLHNHLSGAIWAEDYIDWARAADFCTTPDGLSLAPPPCAPGHSLTQGAGDDTAASDRLIDALSTRGWQQGIGQDTISGHTQFFQTFARFGAIAQGHSGPMLAALRRQAALDQLSYLEIDHNTDLLSAHALRASPDPMREADIPALFAAERPGVEALLDQASVELTQSETQARQILACDTAQAEPACAITTHYLFQALRALPPRQVFRSLLTGFAMAAHDPRYVGINIVMPEDAPIALADYDLHMAMIRFLAARYPQVHRSLHAGELAFGAVPPRDLADHIAKAVDAGAQRIGHGVDIAYETNAAATMARMARQGIAVEINLSSNAVILGVQGADHPVNLYRHHGVPIALATDDQGVLRIDMTHEYVRAIREQGFTYADLKQSARASLEYAFLPGASLWSGRRLGAPVSACAINLVGKTCAALLASSEKARLQAALEVRLARFERDTKAMAPPKNAVMAQ